MRRKQSLLTVAASALLALAAIQCAHGTQPAVPATQKKPKMTSTLHKIPSGAHTLAEYPQFTAQEMGKRTLALIDSLKSFDELSLERIREVTGFPMKHTPPGETYIFEMYLPESNWDYWFEYGKDETSGEKSGGLIFANSTDNYTNALMDMSPVCLDYDSYINTLKNMGFKNKYSQYHELGWILATFYARNNVAIQVVRRREADQPESKASHACLGSIYISKWTK